MRRALLALLSLLALGASDARAAIVEELEVPTREGTVHVELARPEGAGKVPVILTYSPYNSLSGTPATNLAEGDPWVEKGYARAYADVLGTRNSTGCWDYGGPKEQRSGVDLVNALASQPWANGKVGMTGVSYDGTTATMVAAAGAEAWGLAAIAPVAAISRWYGYAYQDGVRYLGNTQHPTDEGFDTPLAFDLGFGRTPPDRVGSLLGGALADRFRPCDAAEHTLRGYSDQPDYDDFWRARDYRKDAGRFRVPTLVVHGWQDFNVKQSEAVDLYSALPAGHRKLLHLHQAPHADGAGDGYEERLERFFAETLKGERTGIFGEPAVRTQARDAAGDLGFQRTTRWPPPGTTTRAFRLSDMAPRGASFTDAGTTTEELALQELRADLSWRSFRTPPLGRDLRIAGTPRLRARVTVDGPTGHLAPTLVDLAPDGTAVPITRGHLNLRYRHGLARGEDLPPGRPVDVTVRFAPQDWVVRKGHRVALVVAASNAAWAVPNRERRGYRVEPDASWLRLPAAPLP